MHYHVLFIKPGLSLNNDEQATFSCNASHRIWVPSEHFEGEHHILSADNGSTLARTLRDVVQRNGGRHEWTKRGVR
jgi:hypothetical protein